MNWKLGFAALIALTLLWHAACRASERNQEMVDLRRSDDCMLVVFHDWVGPTELRSFFDAHVLSKAPAPGGGSQFRVGLISILRRSGGSNPESYEICFSTDSTSDLRKNIRDEISVAPEVRRVETVEIDPMTDPSTSAQQ